MTKPISEALSCADFYTNIKVVTRLPDLRVNTILYRYRCDDFIIVSRIVYEQRGTRKYVSELSYRKSKIYYRGNGTKRITYSSDPTEYHLYLEEAKRCYIIGVINA